MNEGSEKCPVCGSKICTGCTELKCTGCHASHEKTEKWVPKELTANDPVDNVLQRANQIVQDRGKDYGHPYHDFKKTAAMWSAILGVEVTPDQCVKCMIAVKLSRLNATPNHQDSIDDIAGYTWCLDEIIKHMKREKCDTEQNTIPSRGSNLDLKA